MIKAFEPQRIEHCRHWTRRTLTTNVVVVKKESEGYVRFAVTSIDDALTGLNAVIDAFLLKQFGRRAAPTPPG